jgi:Transposase DDE domain group 1
VTPSVSNYAFPCLRFDLTTRISKVVFDPAFRAFEFVVRGESKTARRRPSHKPVVWYKGFLYRAASWKTARRVVAKVEFHFGELFPRVGFIVTNLSLSSRAIVRFYNKRGTAEQWIKEGKQATHWTRLSCHRFRANEARLQLSLLAYNLGNLWRRLVLPKRIDTWSLTSLQQRLVKTGGRLVKHARYYWLLLAEGHLHRRLFGQMLRRIYALPAPSG